MLKGRVHVHGSSGVELASGVHWFLKHFAGCSVSWHATGGLQLSHAALSPAALAAMESKGLVRVERAVPFSFYQNVVTMSYSMAFWDWDRWEAELDWMALQGINMPLMPLGMEALLTATFTSLGLTASQLDDFFPGPAFLAWGRMGNIQGYAGPLPPAYRSKQLSLAKRVVSRMRQLGMTPVYPAFAGFVPSALKELHPQASVTPASNWCHFPPGYCCPLMLDPADPLYARIGAAYITTLRQQLGWDDASYYIADTFNEMKPSSDDPAYLRGVAASVFEGMTAADPQAHWVMQAWLFFSDSRFWQPPQIQALLAGVPRGRMLLLDLFADEHPVWSRTASMYGHPFIWCMLHNFGGNLELYGALPNVAEGVAAALAAAPDNLVGVGMTPEGIEQNPAVYEFMAEMAYKGQAAQAAVPGGLGSWFRDYGSRRYAAAGPLPDAAAAALQGAWQLLARSVYSCRDGLHNTVCDIPTSRPGLGRAEIMGWGLAPHLWYDVGDVRAAWELLLQAGAAAPALAQHSSAFVYDLVDVTRELLSKVAGRFWSDAVTAYRAGSREQLRAAGQSLTSLLSDMDVLLGCHHGFMLGPVLQRARQYAVDDTAAGAAAAAAGSRDVDMADADTALTAAVGWGVPNKRSLKSAAPLSKGGGGGSSSSVASSDTAEQLLLTGESDMGVGLPEAATEQQQREELARFYEWNLRTQLTIWGTSAAAGDSEVSDYANKEWAGLISTFYLPRWQAWLARLDADLEQGRAYDAPAWRLEVLLMTYRWIATGSVQAAGGAAAAAAVGPEGEQSAAASVSAVALSPQGDAMALSHAAYERYGRLLAPGCAVTAATAAGAAAAAAAGLPIPPASSGMAATAAAAAAAAAAAVVGAAAGAAAAVVAGNSTASAVEVAA